MESNMKKILLGVVIGAVAIVGTATGLALDITSKLTKEQLTSKEVQKNPNKEQPTPTTTTTNNKESQNKEESDKVIALRGKLKESFENINYQVSSGKITKERAIEKIDEVKREALTQDVILENEEVFNTVNSLVEKAKETVNNQEGNKDLTTEQIAGKSKLIDFISQVETLKEEIGQKYRLSLQPHYVTLGYIIKKYKLAVSTNDNIKGYLDGTVFFFKMERALALIQEAREELNLVISEGETVNFSDDRTPTRDGEGENWRGDKITVQELIPHTEKELWRFRDWYYKHSKELWLRIKAMWNTPYYNVNEGEKYETWNGEFLRRSVERSYQGIWRSKDENKDVDWTRDIIIFLSNFHNRFTGSAGLMPPSFVSVSMVNSLVDTHRRIDQAEHKHGYTDEVKITEYKKIINTFIGNINYSLNYYKDNITNPLDSAINQLKTIKVNLQKLLKNEEELKTQATTGVGAVDRVAFYMNLHGLSYQIRSYDAYVIRVKSIVWHLLQVGEFQDQTLTEAEREVPMVLLRNITTKITAGSYTNKQQLRTDLVNAKAALFRTIEKFKKYADAYLEGDAIVSTLKILELDYDGVQLWNTFRSLDSDIELARMIRNQGTWVKSVGDRFLNALNTYKNKNVVIGKV